MSVSKDDGQFGHDGSGQSGDPNPAEQGQGHVSDIPLVFLKEQSLFKDRVPEKSEWLSHTELYYAISDKIDPTHIRGLQRIGGLWRIYLDTIQDKITLMNTGVPLRGYIIPVLPTNPNRLDGEQTTRIRVKNVPLSVDDGCIKTGITSYKVEVIDLYREKLRIKGRLTNCETGDRIVIVKTSSLKCKIPRSVYFGQFGGLVFYPGQNETGTQINLKCSKCRQSGHLFRNCPNDWVCATCGVVGHKKADCDIPEFGDSSESESESDAQSDTETPASDTIATSQTPVSAPSATSQSRRQARSISRPRENGDPRIGQQSMERYVQINMASSDNASQTPNKGKAGHAQEHSPPTPANDTPHISKATAKKKKK